MTHQPLSGQTSGTFGQRRKSKELRVFTTVMFADDIDIDQLMRETIQGHQLSRRLAEILLLRAAALENITLRLLSYAGMSR